PSMFSAPPTPRLFPYTTLFRSSLERYRNRGRLGRPVGRMIGHRAQHVAVDQGHSSKGRITETGSALGDGIEHRLHIARRDGHDLDRKSTRLNSSHLGISYAVFC